MSNKPITREFFEKLDVFDQMLIMKIVERRVREKLRNAKSKY